MVPPTPSRNPRARTTVAIVIGGGAATERRPEERTVPATVAEPLPRTPPQQVLPTVGGGVLVAPYRGASLAVLTIRRVPS